MSNNNDLLNSVFNLLYNILNGDTDNEKCSDCNKCDCECKCNDKETEYDEETYELDLTKDDDYEYALNKVNEIKNLREEIGDSFSSIFGNYIDSEFDGLIKELENGIKRAHKSKKKSEIKNEPKRPSECVPTEVGLQIHKLTDKYCEEYIRPKFDDTEMCNNIYGGLYEYACWIYNQTSID